MDSNNAPKRVKSGGTQISRRTVTRGVAWSAPIAAIGVAAPAFAASGREVEAGQCGVACKHPGAGQNDKTYHFTFCFEVGTTAVVGGTINLGLMTINGDAGRQAYSGTTGPAGTGSPKTTVTVGLPGSQATCVFVDADGFGTSEAGIAKLNFTYFLEGVAQEQSGCAIAQINGDVCGTSKPGTNLQLQPGNWPHSDGSDPTHPGISRCAVDPGLTCR